MKWFLSILFTISLWVQSPAAMAVSCQEIQKDLLAIEFKIQNSQLPKCKDSGQTFCCKKGSPCGSRAKYLQEYNEAMAKLTIAEGIIALGMALESNHNALSDVKNSTLNEASFMASQVQKNLDKSEALDFALEDPSFWNGYEGKSKSELKSFVRGNCREDKSHKLCQMIIKIKTPLKEGETKPYQISDENVYEVLHGFMTADEYVGSDSERRSLRLQRFPGYRKRLQIKKAGTGDLMSPSEYRANPLYTKVKDIKGMIAEYQSEKDENKKADLGKKILQYSNDLNKISVQYHDNAPSSGTANNFIRETLYKTQAMLELPDLVLTNEVPINMSKVSKVFGNDLKTSERALLNDRDLNLELKARYSTQCQGDTTYRCLDKICPNGQCPTGGGRLPLAEYYKRAKQLKEAKSFDKNVLSKAKVCLNNPKLELEKKRNCLLQLYSGNQGKMTVHELSKLRENMEAAQKKIEYQDFGQPFLDLNLQKGMAIQALNSYSCRQKNDSDFVRHVSSVCNSPELESDTTGVSYEALNLIANGEDIMINLNLKNHRLISKEQAPDQEIKNMRATLLDKCSQSSPQTGLNASLCKFYVDQKAHEEAVAKAKKKREEARKQAQKDSGNRIVIHEGPREPSDTEVFLGSFFDTFTAGYAYGVIPAKVEMQGTRVQTGIALQNIATAEEEFDLWKKNMHLRNDTDPMLWNHRVNLRNYGHDYFRRNYEYRTSFQSGATQNAYYDPITNPFAHNFAAIPTTVTSGGKIPSSSSSTSETGMKIHSFTF